MSVVAKILLPMIEKLLDRMVGSKYFTLLDLAQGYHQMEVLPSGDPIWPSELKKKRMNAV